MADASGKGKEPSEEQMQELQKGYMEMQAIDQQLKLVNKHVQALDQQVEEIGVISESVQEMGQVRQGTDVFVPVANGIFAKAKIAGTEELLVNVGAGVVVPKKLPDVQKLLVSQQERVREVREEMSRKTKELQEQSKKVEGRLKGLIG